MNIDELKNKLAERMFDGWMNEKHPYFEPVNALIFILIVVGALVLLVLTVFFGLTWKSFVVLFIVFINWMLVYKLMKESYADSFIQEHKKK